MQGSRCGTVCHLFFSQQKQRCFESSLYSISELLLLTGNCVQLAGNCWPAPEGRLAQRPPARQPATTACDQRSGRSSAGQLPATGQQLLASGCRPAVWAHQQHHRDCISFLPPTLPMPEGGREGGGGSKLYLPQAHVQCRHARRAAATHAQSCERCCTCAEQHARWHAL